MANDTPASEPLLIGKVASVTGGARGLGLETSRQLAARGAHVIVAARDAAKAQAAAKIMCGVGFDASALELDVTREADRQAAYAAIENAHGRLDILINNAGILLDSVDGGTPADSPPRLFGAAEYGGALFGEVIAIARQINSDDYDSWCDAMSKFADRPADEAADQLRRGHKISARDNFLRACNYYRNAEFLLHAHADDPRVKRAFELSTACYRQAAPLFAPPIEPVEIPFEGTTLTGYFHHADTAGHARKTLLLNSGFDGSPEEMHFMGARAAVERGYNVLVFDGPAGEAA